MTATQDGCCYEELFELSTCPCGKFGTDMKILPCMDFACLACLQQLLSQQQQQQQQQHSGQEMNCPSCGQAFPVPEQGLEHLPSNVYVKAIAPAPDDVEQPAKFRTRQQTQRCSTCSINTIASELKYCKECSQYLCERCVAVHRNLRLAQNHHVVDRRLCFLADCGSVTCRHHPKKSPEVFCNDCASLGCVVCLREVHGDHDWCDADEISERLRQQLDGDVQTVRRAASQCDQELQRLENAEKRLTEHIRAVKSQISSHRNDVVDAIDREVTRLHDTLAEEQNANVQRLQKNGESIRKQKRILQCFEKFGRSIVETGSVHEVIHVYNSMHGEDMTELPLQEVSSDAEIPQYRFTPVNVYDFLPDQAQRVIGSVSLADEDATEHPAWNQLQSQLQEALEQLDQLQHDVTCLEERLAEKAALLETAEKELGEKSSLVDQLERQGSDMASDVKQKQDAINRFDSLSRQLVETTQNHQSQLHECESKLEKTTLDLHESERRAGEFLVVVNQLNVRVQELEELLSCSADKEEQMATQLEDAWQQINEQSTIIEHVPPSAGMGLTSCCQKTPCSICYPCRGYALSGCICLFISRISQ